ncbi:MAG: EthD domain-containing protein [Bacteroidetes bacterium]|nr:EthD domain-containing protein [Bacteroidota bacterium]
MCLFTLFKQKQDISYDAFIHFWHEVHTPLSLKILPLWNYNRNVVKQKRTEDSVHWDGIVEEQFKTTSDLLNPLKFFGNPLVMFYRMWQVYIDTKSFLDYDSIEPYFAHEIYIKS